MAWEAGSHYGEPVPMISSPGHSVPLALQAAEKPSEKVSIQAWKALVRSGQLLLSSLTKAFLPLSAGA